MNHVNQSIFQRPIAALKPSYQLLSILLASCLGYGFALPTYAEERIRWTPDSDRGSVESTLSGGRRGQASASCSAAADSTQLALIVPGDQSRLLTTNTSPTLAWHVATTKPVSITLHVSDPDIATPIYTKTIEIDKTAAISVALPAENRLALNKRYRWTVFVSCPGEHQTEISARSFIEPVNGEFLDVSHLSSLEQADVYANQGIWYDAVAVLLDAGNQGITNAETMVQTLLEQGRSPAQVSLAAVIHL